MDCYGRHVTRRNVILAVLAVIVLVEVFGRDDYARVMQVHLDVLAAMAGKMAAVADVGKRPTPHDLTEIVYPLDRARQFVDTYEDHRSRESYGSFLDLIEVYQGFVLEVDAARGSPERWEQFRPLVDARVASIQAAVTRSRSALEAES